jgi:hypothetical protein
MIPEQPDSTFCRQRAAIYAQLAAQAISAEAATTLLYLEQIWIVIAEVADAIKGGGAATSLESDLRHSAPN